MNSHKIPFRNINHPIRAINGRLLNPNSKVRYINETALTDCVHLFNKRVLPAVYGIFFIANAYWVHLGADCDCVGDSDCVIRLAVLSMNARPPQHICP